MEHLHWLLLVLISFASLLAQRISLNISSYKFCKFIYLVSLFLVRCHSLKKKSKFLTPPPCEYSTLHFVIYTPSLSPYAYTKCFIVKKRKIKYTSIFYLYLIKIPYKIPCKGLDPYTTC